MNYKTQKITIPDIEKTSINKPNNTTTTTTKKMKQATKIRHKSTLRTKEKIKNQLTLLLLKLKTKS